MDKSFGLRLESLEAWGYDREFCQFNDQLRLQTAAFSGLSLEDSIWSPAGAAADRRNSQADAAGLFGVEEDDGGKRALPRR
jgi:hypothetical protein